MRNHLSFYSATRIMNSKAFFSFTVLYFIALFWITGDHIAFAQCQGTCPPRQGVFMEIAPDPCNKYFLYFIAPPGTTAPYHFHYTITVPGGFPVIYDTDSPDRIFEDTHGPYIPGTRVQLTIRDACGCVYVYSTQIIRDQHFRPGLTFNITSNPNCTSRMQINRGVGEPVGITLSNFTVQQLSPTLGSIITQPLSNTFDNLISGTYKVCATLTNGGFNRILNRMVEHSCNFCTTVTIPETIPCRGGTVNFIGTVNHNQTVCGEINNIGLVLTGFQGNIAHWESSTDGGITWPTTISNNTRTLNIGPVNVSTCYRAVITSPNCPNNPCYSTIACITVVNPVNHVITSNPPRICAGDPCPILSLSPNEIDGAIQWERQTLILGPGSGSRWDIIPSATGINFHPAECQLNYSPVGRFLRTNCYRAIIHNDPCPVETISFCLPIDPPSVGGSVSPINTVLCGTVNDFTLTLSGYQTGQVQNWQRSEGCTSSWTDIPNTLPTLHTGPISATVCFRAVVRNGACPIAYSQPAKITINPTPDRGTFPNDMMICPDDPCPMLTLTNYTGTIDQWETSPNCASPWTIIPNITPSQMANCNTSGCYRVLLRLGNCSVYSPNIRVTINPVLVVNVATTGTCLNSCDGTATVTVTGGTPPYTFAWNCNNPLPQCTTDHLTDLCVGNYTVLVTDANGCTNTTNVAIEKSPPLHISGITCDGCRPCSGANTPGNTVTICFDGGTGPYNVCFTSINPTYTVPVCSTSYMPELGTVPPYCVTIVVPDPNPDQPAPVSFRYFGWVTDKCGDRVETDIAGAQYDPQPFKVICTEILNQLTGEVTIFATAYGGTSPFNFTLTVAGFPPVMNGTGVFGPFRPFPIGPYPFTTPYTIVATDGGMPQCTTDVDHSCSGFFGVTLPPPFKQQGQNVTLSNKKSELAFELYPNPNQGEFTLSIESEETTEAQYEILNMLRQTIQQGSWKMQAGNNELPMQLRHVPKGVYMLRITTANGSERSIKFGIE